MAIAVAMPKLGMAMKKGTVGKWLRAVGENVEAGEDLLEISTQKITATIPAPTAGVLLRIDVPEKAEVPVGTVLAYIGVPDEDLPEPSVVPVTPVKATAAAAPAPARAARTTPTAEVQASPAARRMARDLEIDIALVSPSAPGRRVTTEDVERFAAEGGSAAIGVEVLPFEGIRAVVAERMTESLQTMAQVTITREVNATELVARREALAPGFEAAIGKRLSYTDLLVRETARLLPEHPILNSTLTEEGIVFQPEVHMGFA
ncbi:MAG: 2-oxo acid dehydrogenase subunit E2, partial [Acidimicrobiia bacterium]|nr:2-oxo acid dehydrogenase subunit E2 [Acidimicrobiia bacterium]